MKKGWPWSTVIVANTHRSRKDTARVNRRRQIARHQQHRMRRHVTNSNAHAFFKLLTDPEL
ncbi:IS4 family transposase, partial [Pseudomonas corrugata]|nr:IS4 family transposase [Pseudomonas corrugata]